MDQPDVFNNIGYRCTRWQCEQGRGDHAAAHWISAGLERTILTFNDLERMSNQFANVFRQVGVQPGDKVFTFMPRAPEVYYAFLGALKYQAVIGVLFPNFGEDALLDRLGDARAGLLITRQSNLRKIQPIWPNLPDLKTILLVDVPQHLSERILSLPALLAQASEQFDIQPTSPTTPSVLHYTSGSTGKPKGAQHIHRSIQAQVEAFREVMQVRSGEVFWCTADPGWVTGTSYGIIAPWEQGVSQVHYSGPYSAEAWMSILERERVGVWFTAPTALRMLMQEDPALFRQFDYSHLRTIFSAGEPLNPKVIDWVHETFGKEIYDIWFQTEIAAVAIGNRPGLPVKPGSMGIPCGWIDAAILDEQGRPLPNGTPGRLCIKGGGPAMFVTYLNQQAQYDAKFSDGYYDTSDIALRDDDGYIWFVGRGDDVINTSGHLVSPFEVESALLAVPEIADVAVIGAPDELLFEKVVAFVRLKPGLSMSKDLEMKLRFHVSNHVSTMATPQDIQVVERIPRNRSGKILRRLLRARYTGADAGDTSTLED